MGNKGFGVSTEDFDVSLAKNYPHPDHQRVLRFWFETAKDKGWSLSDLARHTGQSTTVISRLFRGIYNADPTSAIDKLMMSMERFDEAIENPEFITTSLAKLMFAAFDKTRSLKTVTIMWGPKGIGKTTITNEYGRLNNHGLTYVMRCPGYGCTPYQFMHVLANALRITTGNKSALQLHEKIGQFLSRGNRELIIDEVHEIFLTCRPRDIVKIFEWIRELYDRYNFGLSLVGTDVMYKNFYTGDYADVLSQLTDRGVIQVPLPNSPTQKDIVRFIEHYGLQMAQEGTPEFQMVNDIIKSAGLRKFNLHLKDGNFTAVKLGERYEWKHFVMGIKNLESLQKRGTKSK